MREFIAELVGTMILVACGLGSLAQQAFAENKNSTVIYAGFAFGCTLGGIITGKVSGKKAASKLN